jgi:hypothetical protein
MEANQKDKTEPTLEKIMKYKINSYIMRTNTKRLLKISFEDDL